MSITKIFCPECDCRLKLNTHPHKGQRILCPECETNLVVVNLNPVELEVALFAKHSAGSGKRASIVEVPCSECDHLIKLSVHARQGQQVVCQMCSATLEVVSTNPLELDVALTHRAGSRWRKI